MSIGQEQHWITGEEYGREYRRLSELGAGPESADFRALRQRVIDRDDHLFAEYGSPLLATHAGKWIAISADGRVLIRETAADAGWAANDEFGPGNFAVRKLAPFPGHDLRS